MKKLNNHESRNFGYGKQLAFAGKQALVDRFGEGKFATRASHEARFTQFATWCKQQGIKDARHINKNVVLAFANALSDRVNTGQTSVNYAQNQLSSVNVVLAAMRGDRSLAVSPASLVGERTHLRQTAPLSLNRASYEAAKTQLQTEHAKLALAFAREFGMRLREAGLFRPQEALKEVQTTGGFNIHRGTKGGRTALRTINPTPENLRLLAQAQKALGRGSLVDRVGNYTQWKNAFYREYERSGAHGLIGKFHDNRAAYACEVYKRVTGAAAPVVAGRRLVSKELDKQARMIISRLLGHGRLDVVAQYIGSSK